eukprot:gnl/TRDRNA2_/TRDRNA2_203180_c0_seq1.p1 gnl/TRDRNA2_/TRDRNA2_203180_c0~~gnl/TRDRNA2_/TRDRNA2_203180_c0_seq1.p1  ORF type:complete len:506 (+),score=56.57 gnl/TRDRNA2_/TRDRNA2_203180_c0_seq1:185-1519(+)
MSQNDCNKADSCRWRRSCYGERDVSCQGQVDYTGDDDNCPGGLAGKACRPLNADSPGNCSTMSATTALCNASQGCQCVDCPPAPICFPNSDVPEETCAHLAIDSCSTGNCYCRNCHVQIMDGRMYSTVSGALTARIVEASVSSTERQQGCDWSTWPANATKASHNEKPQGAPTAGTPGASVIDHFKRVALAEHASVASFSRTALDLMEHVAPAGLLDRTLAAARDEIQHAQMAFALVHAWSAQPVQLTGFDGQLGEHGGLALADLARRTVTEACASETPAVLRAAMSRRFAQDTQVLEYLQAVLTDERRHAELAWATVQWTLLRAHSSGGRLLTMDVWREVDTALEFSLASMRVQAVSDAVEARDAEEEVGLLRFGILAPRLNAVVARLALKLVEQLRSELVVDNPTGRSLSIFEASIGGHFESAIEEVQALDAEKDFEAQQLV